MPDTTTATPPPAAPAAAPSTPAPAAPKPIESNERHPALKNLMASLQTQTPPGEPTKQREKPVETPKSADAPAATKPTDDPAAPADKPIKVRKPKAPERPPLPTSAPVAAAPTPPPAAPAAPVATNDLSEEEQGMLDDSKDMEKFLGQKHAGLAQKTEKFLRDNKARRAQLEKEGVDPDSDQEYANWFKANKPKVGERDYEMLRQERATLKAKELVTKENDDIRHELHVRDEEPKVRREVDNIYSELARTALPDEVNEELAKLTKEFGGDSKKAWERLNETHKLEIDVSGRVLDAATKDMELFIKLTRETPSKRPLLAFDANNPDHMRIHQMIGDTCAAFKEHAPRENQVRDGKWFVTRDEWNQLPAEQRPNFWTFTNAELLKVAQRGIKPVILKSIEAKRKELEAMGFSRAPRAAAPAAPVTPPVATPRTSLNPSPIPTTPSTAPAVDPRASSMHSRMQQARGASVS